MIVLKLKAVDFNYFYFYLFFFILFLELEVGLVTTSLGHISVTLDNMVTIIVTSHMMQRKT